MPLYRCLVSVAADSILARDRTVNTFYLNDGGALTNPGNLAEDIATIFAVYYTGGREIDVRLYDMADAVPRQVKGTFVRDLGLAPASAGPREVACCLSYRGAQNVPRQRGRMFMGVASAGRGTTGVRPQATTMSTALQLGQAIADLGGPDVDWVVHSPTANSQVPVKLAWVDDEWDTMRSRGLRSTTRQTLVLDE